MRLSVSTRSRAHSSLTFSLIRSSSSLDLPILQLTETSHFSGSPARSSFWWSASSKDIRLVRPINVASSTPGEPASSPAKEARQDSGDRVWQVQDSSIPASCGLPSCHDADTSHRAGLVRPPESSGLHVEVRSHFPRLWNGSPSQDGTFYTGIRDGCRFPSVRNMVLTSWCTIRRLEEC